MHCHKLTCWHLSAKSIDVWSIWYGQWWHWLSAYSACTNESEILHKKINYAVAMQVRSGGNDDLTYFPDVGPCFLPCFPCEIEETEVVQSILHNLCCCRLYSPGFVLLSTFTDGRVQLPYICLLCPPYCCSFCLLQLVCCRSWPSLRWSPWKLSMRVSTSRVGYQKMAPYFQVVLTNWRSSGYFARCLASQGQD